ncbi:hypothetical protein SAMN02745121_00492 [Nannocystis exedens]|uniref:Uncharacterized protein n=1 Tax=Nannocystis exedens TaxID=54 RepID=A0A1I1T4S5_9BACT|nr:hypothetical protein NAEX_09373 [Nannocystis exedens]SFD53705.1 hypothetical protein SAMN02745121_00492 [Nannocystis exedens]
MSLPITRDPGRAFSASNAAIVYASSPVEHPALHTTGAPAPRRPSRTGRISRWNASSWNCSRNR